MSESEKIREKIIDAAVERFLHYGYPKTTIAELAGDCAMSPGNIYRFFKGKIDIAAEIARREACRRLSAWKPCWNVPIAVRASALKRLCLPICATRFICWKMSRACLNWRKWLSGTPAIPD